MWWVSLPGPDIVVADEAHLVKDKKTVVYEALGLIKTKRRVALTGSPIQNNLMEYFHMVNWIRPLFLSSEKDFKARFVM
jgi:transcriptional regulator ATRX